MIGDLARARSGISLHAGNAKFQAEVGRRLKGSLTGSFQRHVFPWLTGALFTGGLISLLPARQKKVYVNPLARSGRSKLAAQQGRAPGGFFLSLLKALVPLFKPILTAFITKQLASVVGGAKDAQEAAEHTAEAAAQT